jgi:pilus assembly protein CpaC
MLKVRFIEASRTAGRDLGVNWFASNESGTRGVNTGLGGLTAAGPGAGGVPIFNTLSTFAGNASGMPFGVALANLASGGTNIDLLITALETKGLARRLAEPDLVALSGDTASFLAGGEFPVPVAQTGVGGAATVTIEFKPFGVQLTFVPTVLANGIINLRLTPSVSQLDYGNAIRTADFLIPALTKREARTTIELRDGQSFAIAGLLQTVGLRDISQVPWLGSVPVIGALFRSTAYQQEETDLVVIVTPHLVEPGVPGDRLATPLDQRLPSNDVDLFLRGKLEVPKKYHEYVVSGRDVVGPYGHMIFFDQQVTAHSSWEGVYK